MGDIVLVAGFWLDGSVWDEVAEQLTAAGHQVHPLTLSGLGDRIDRAGPDVGLETHVDDIVEYLEKNDLRDVVLVGHSYGALPVTGAADRVPGRIRRLVYVDSGPLADGMAMGDTFAPDTKAYVEEHLVDGWRLPLPAMQDLDSQMHCATTGLGKAEWARMLAAASDQPAATYTEPVVLTGAVEAVPATLVSCQFPLAAIRDMIASGNPMFAPLGGPRWTLVELPTGHWPMLSEPKATASILTDAVDQ
jgi:pimeloyl-ACP methyl ester carboxylesterase